ncbi:MAG: NAD-dependent epimerase/dehydratase family protein, partial [Massilia sp.]
MNTYLLALQLLAVQGVLGAFDTLYHHELSEALPSRPSALRELKIHALRSMIYSALFIGMALWRFDGLWAAVLMTVLVVEIGLTLWDFVVEDQTRLLPATERVTHTILAINGGAFITLLALNLPAWLAMPTALTAQALTPLTAFLALCGAGVGISGLRDGFAARTLTRLRDTNSAASAPHFATPSSSFLVTGATGFIGQNLVHALLRDGQRVTVLTRSPKQAAWQFDGRVECISDMQQLPPSRRFDVVINLAGAPVLGWRWTAKRRAQLRHSRVGLTNRLVAW